MSHSEIDPQERGEKMPKAELVMARAQSRPGLKCEPDDPAWVEATGVEISSFPWYVAGTKQATRVRLLYDEESLYARFECRDKHISASRTEPNTDVCEDSCVELFASPFPDRKPDYFNLEINCCGTMLLGYGPDRWERRQAPVQLFSRIDVYHTVPGPTKEVSADDDGWMIDLRLPFAVISEIAQEQVLPLPAFWRGNLYRCGGVADPQYGCWAPVVAPKPDYHRPEQFGTFRFQGE